MNTSSPGPSIPICCNPNNTRNSFHSFCYGNDSFIDDEIVFPKMYGSNESISNLTVKNFVRCFTLICGDFPLRIRVMSEVQDIMGMFMFENGTIFAKNYFQYHRDDIKYLLDMKDYCFEFLVLGPIRETVIAYCDTLTDRYLHNIQKKQMRSFIVAITDGLMLPFLIATFIVYTIVPELRNIHGLIFRVYIACLLSMPIRRLLNFARVVHCTYALGITVHFTALAQYFWLNVMCFDIWWTFRKYKPLEHSKRVNRKKFLVYSIYAWGCPALFAGIGAITDNLPNVHQGIIRPGFHSHCWFTNNLAMGIYFDAPVVLTLISNAYFFISTSITMIRHKENVAQQFEGSDSRWHEDDKQRFKLYLRLFIIMGIIKSFEIVLSKVLQKFSTDALYFINLPNFLEGLTIFIIFVWKKNVKQLLWKRLGWKDRTFCPRKSTNRTRLLPDSNIHPLATLQESASISSPRFEPITTETCHL